MILTMVSQVQPWDRRTCVMTAVLLSACLLYTSRDWNQRGRHHNDLPYRFQQGSQNIQRTGGLEDSYSDNETQKSRENFPYYFYPFDHSAKKAFQDIDSLTEAI